MNAEQLEQIRARVDAITLGEWHTDGPNSIDVWIMPQTIYQRREMIADHIPSSSDVDFIAHAPSDVRALLEHIAQLEAERDNFRKAANQLFVERDGYLALLRGLVGDDRQLTWWNDAAKCNYCGNIVIVSDGPAEPHEPDCAWAKAQQIVGGNSSTT